MWKLRVGLLTVMCALSLWPADQKAGTRGRQAFEKRCTGCHSTDRIKVGPPLRGIFGRHAATHPGFPYSDSLKAAPLIWDGATLDRWLADPESVVPDTDMAFRVSESAERMAIIAYLKQLTTREERPR
jgi:cytochrome c